MAILSAPTNAKAFHGGPAGDNDGTSGAAAG